MTTTMTAVSPTFTITEEILVRATLDDVSPAETVRRLSTAILNYDQGSINDDATLLLIDYHGITP